MGLFMPMMMIGAGIGRLYSESVRYTQGITEIEQLNPGFYALIGAASMVTGTTRLILTVVVIF